MYARSTTLHGSPGKIDAAVAFVRHEAAPLLETIEGCRGLSMLADRETARCIVTSSWESEEALHRSDAELRPFRDRARDILGGSMQVDDWEVSSMHRTQHGECCRVTWLQGDQAAMPETFRAGVLPRLEQVPGFCSASLLLSPTTGLACATTAWESRAAMEAGRQAVDDVRRQAAADTGTEIVEVQEFDLVYAHLHVPELA